MSFENFSILTCAFRIACQPHRSNHHKNGKDNQNTQREKNGVAFEGNLISDIFLCWCFSSLLQLVRFSDASIHVNAELVIRMFFLVLNWCFFCMALLLLSLVEVVVVGCPDLGLEDIYYIYVQTHIPNGIEMTSDGIVYQSAVSYVLYRKLDTTN